MDDGLPLLLTVEEAGAVLRIGRTKAYAMAREWRDTQGRSGLPVIDLGNVLRVPRRALEQLIGYDLAGRPLRNGDERAGDPDDASSTVTTVPAGSQPTNTAGDSEFIRLRHTRNGARSTPPDDQLPLFARRRPHA